MEEQGEDSEEQREDSEEVGSESEELSEQEWSSDSEEEPPSLGKMLGYFN